jgi:hypothetical protein
MVSIRRGLQVQRILILTSISKMAKMGSYHWYAAPLLLLGMSINFAMYTRPWNSKIPKASRDVQTPSVDHGILLMIDAFGSHPFHLCKYIFFD